MRPTALFFLPILAACNGGGADHVHQPPADFTRGEIAALAADIDDARAFATATPRGDVPTSGEAHYAGTLDGTIAVPGVRSDFAGLIDMNIDFRRGEVGGAIGHLVEDDGDRIEGVLTLQGGRLDRAVNPDEVVILSGVGGNLRGAGGERIAIDADLAGGFGGRDARFVGAEIDGAAIVDGASGTFRGTTALDSR